MTTAKKTHWLRNTLIVLIICGIAGTALAAILFLSEGQPSSATATLLLSFNGAGDGRAPNGNEYDIQEAASDAVLEAALEKTGFTGVYTAEQLRENLVIVGAYPEDIAEQVLSYDSLLNFAADRTLTVTDYYPTEFSLTLYNEFDRDISLGNLQNLAKGITEAYREYFIEKYSLKWDNSTGMQGWDALDYSQQMTVLSQNLIQAARFVEVMYNKEPAFKAGGMGFNDILARLNSLNDNDVARLEASIVQNALTKRENRLLTQYRYQIETWGNQVAHMQNELKELDAMITAYEKGEIIYVTTSNTMNQVGGTASETYDTLVRRRTDTVTEITRINKDIARAEKRIEELVGTGQVTEEEAAEALTAAETATEGTEGAGAGTDSAVAEATEAKAETATETKAEEKTEEKAEEKAEEVVTEMTDEEKTALHEQQIAALEGRIEKLLTRQDEVIADLNKVLTAYNEEEMTEGTIRMVNLNGQKPTLLSGNFLKRVIKEAGPICAVGFIVCMILLIRSRRKEQKRTLN